MVANCDRKINQAQQYFKGGDVMKWIARFVVGLALVLPLLALTGCGNGDGDGVEAERTCTWEGSNWDECDWE